MLPHLRITNKIQPIADPDRLLITSTLKKDLLRGWANKMVGKVKESSAVQIWAAPVLLALVLSYTVYNGQSTTNEIKELNKNLTILQTQKVEQDKVLDRERQEKFQLVREQEAYRERMKDQIRELQFVLKDKLPKGREN